MRFRRLLALTFIATSAVGAQTSATVTTRVGRIRGQVVSTAGPVRRAEISLQSMRGVGPDRITVSDSSGNFAFDSVTAGGYLIQARHIGHQPANTFISVSDGSDATVSIRLEVAPTTLDTVTVQGIGVPARYGPNSRMTEFYARKEHGVGHFFTRDSIDALAPIDVASIVRRVLGVRATRSDHGRVIVNMTHCQTAVFSQQAQQASAGSSKGPVTAPAEDHWGPIALYIDGAVVQPENRVNVFSALRPGEIEAIEVYRSPTELPAEAMGNTCGAIYVWTRFGAMGKPR